MLLASLGFIAVVLTCTMFATKSAMLGFPCALFWAIFGADAYVVSTIPWGDIYFYMAFGSLLGMTPFTALAAFALREKHDTIADESMEKGEGGFIDEGSSEVGKMDAMFSTDGDGKRSRRTDELHKRAEDRRSGKLERR